MLLIMLTILLPYIVLNGPQKMGLKPMKSIYIALLRLMIEPEVWYVSATSGTAAKTLVEEMGARKLQRQRMHTIRFLRPWENLL